MHARTPLHPLAKIAEEKETEKEKGTKKMEKGRKQQKEAVKHT